MGSTLDYPDKKGTVTMTQKYVFRITEEVSDNLSIFYRMQKIAGQEHCGVML